MYIICIDSGTTNTRFRLYNEETNLVVDSIKKISEYVIPQLKATTKH